MRVKKSIISVTLFIKVMVIKSLAKAVIVSNI